MPMTPEKRRENLRKGRQNKYNRTQGAKVSGPRVPLYKVEAARKFKVPDGLAMMDNRIVYAYPRKGPNRGKLQKIPARDWDSMTSDDKRQYNFTWGTEEDNYYQLSRRGSGRARTIRVHRSLK